MTDADHLRREIVAPALRHIGMWSEAAENLLLGTAAVESRMGTYLRQIGGPALGIWQVEPATHLDCWDNWLDYRPDAARLVLDLVPRIYRLPDDSPVPVDPQALASCPLYCCAIARIVYRRAPEPLPAPTDWAALEAYHKRRYNTVAGKTKLGEFIAKSGADHRQAAVAATIWLRWTTLRLGARRARPTVPSLLGGVAGLPGNRHLVRANR